MLYKNNNYIYLKYFLKFNKNIKNKIKLKLWYMLVKMAKFME